MLPPIRINFVTKRTQSSPAIWNKLNESDGNPEPAPGLAGQTARE
jgi:hypothetical protein